MVIPTSYKVRLIFAASSPGVFNWKATSHCWQLPTGNRATLCARHVESLDEATEFHLDVGGFETAESALHVGELLRSALRLTNAVLALGLNVPSGDQEVNRAKLAPHVKEKIAKEHGAKIVDCVFGLNVLKDGEEFELAVKGELTAKPSNSAYILEAGSSLWGLGDSLDEPSKLACELLNSASRDASPRSAFLISFLALDLLLERTERSKESLEVIDELATVVSKSTLESAEKGRLQSVLGNLKNTSLSAELDHLVSLGTNSEIEVNEEPLAAFIIGCVKLRNKLAHPPKDASASKRTEDEIAKRRDGLRQIVLSIIWARNKLPKFSVERPGDVVSISEMKISIL